MAALDCPRLGVEEGGGGVYVGGVLEEGREGVGRFDAVALEITFSLDSLLTSKQLTCYS